MKQIYQAKDARGESHGLFDTEKYKEEFITHQLMQYMYEMADIAFRHSKPMRRLKTYSAVLLHPPSPSSSFLQFFASFFVPDLVSSSTPPLRATDMATGLIRRIASAGSSKVEEARS